MQSARDIKVLQVVPSLQIGGAEQVGVFLAGAFAAPGRTALCAVNPGLLAGQLRECRAAFAILHCSARPWRSILAAMPGVSWAWRRLHCRRVNGTDLRLPPSRPYADSPEVARRFADVLRGDSYEVIHLHTLECASLLALARQHARAVVFSQHNILSQRHSRDDIAYLKQQLRLVDAVVCPSQVSRSDFVAQTGFPSVRTRVISNPSLLAGGPREGRGEIQRFGTISNLGAAKGIDVLLAAWKSVQKRGLRLELTIAGGDGAVTRAWQAAARKLGLDPGPVFLGQLRSRAEVKDFYRHLDVALIPSRTEAFSLAAADAMSQGVPVIASDIPALREVLGDAALLFSSGDAEGLAKVVARVYQDPQLAQRHAAAGYERWQRCFQASSIARQYLGFYRSLTAPAALPAAAASSDSCCATSISAHLE